MKVLNELDVKLVAGGVSADCVCYDDNYDKAPGVKSKAECRERCCNGGYYAWIWKKDAMQMC